MSTDVCVCVRTYAHVILIACSHCYCCFPLVVSQCQCSLNFVQLTELYFIVRGLHFTNISSILILHSQKAFVVCYCCYPEVTLCGWHTVKIQLIILTCYCCYPEVTLCGCHTVKIQLIILTCYCCRCLLFVTESLCQQFFNCKCDYQ